MKTNPLTNMPFGANERRERISAGVSQNEIAEATGINRTYLSRIESGAANPSLSVIVALAKALNVHTSELFTSL